MPTTVVKTIKSSAGDYTSLSAWEAGEQGNLVSADEVRVAECYAFQDTTLCLIDGSVTDATRFMRIIPASGNRASAQWSTSKYRLEVTDDSCLQLGDHATEVDGIQVGVLLATNAVHHKVGIHASWNFSLGANQYQTVKGCLVRIDTTGRTDNTNIRPFFIESGAPASTPDPQVFVRNCYAYRIGGGAGYNDHKGFSVDSVEVDSIIYNCAAVDLDHGFFRGGSASGVSTLKNCWTRNCTTGFNGTYDAASDYNRASDANSVPGSNSQNSVTVSLVDYSNKDFHLASGDTVCKDAGVNLSGDSLMPFTDSIDGVTRSAPWDIGPHEIDSGTSTFPRRWATAG